jgi:hypothetical protein
MLVIRYSYLYYYNEGEHNLKNQILAILLFSWGMIGKLTLLILSVQNPCNYDGIDGFKGFMLAYDLSRFNYLFNFLLIISIFIYFLKEFKTLYRKFKKWDKSNE